MFGILPAFCDDLGLGDYSSGVENAWYGQKKITDEEFEKTVKKLEEKRNKKKKKKIKGKNLQEEDHSGILNEVSETGNLLLLPLNLITTDNIEIPVSHYQVQGKRIKNKIYLDFYQSHSMIARIEATETENDFGQSTINFVKVLPYDEARVKLIYGSLEFNAYSFVDIKPDNYN